MDSNNITKLGKDFLEMLEDLQQEHRSNFDKLYLVLSDIEKQLKKENNITLPLATFIKQADYFDKEKFSHLRKRVLDKTNDIIRDNEYSS
jgi:hypothetical protein